MTWRTLALSPTSYLRTTIIVRRPGLAMRLTVRFDATEPADRQYRSEIFFKGGYLGPNYHMTETSALEDVEHRANKIMDKVCS